MCARVIPSTLMVYVCVAVPWLFLARHWYSPASASDISLKRKILLKLCVDVRVSDNSASFLTHWMEGVGLERERESERDGERSK